MARTSGTSSARSASNSVATSAVVTPSSGPISGSMTWLYPGKNAAYSRDNSSAVSRYGTMVAKSLAGRAAIQA